MTVTELFIRRPVMTTLVMVALLFFGLIGYVLLPISYLPTIDFPTIQVSASLPGANAQTTASSVAAPLEKEFSSIAGLQSMSSVSGEGSTSITLQFNLERQIDNVSMDVQSSISKAMGALPPNMPSPPAYEKVNPSDQPVLYLVMYSDSLPLATVNDYAKTFVSQTLSMVSGVAQVLIWGEQKYTVRVKLDPRKLAAKGIGLDEVKTAVDDANVNLPLGTLDGRTQSLTIKADGQLMEAERYKSVIVSYQKGQPVRLEDLGEVYNSVENDKSLATCNDKQIILLAVKRQPGSNTIKVVEGAKAMLPTIQAQLPAAVKMEVIYDGSVSINESIHDVKFTLGLAICLVILVVFIFLRNLAGTFIAAVAVPLSIVATFAFMYQLKFSLDNLSLMALTLAVGFVVDDAIVMLENVVRHIHLGKKPFQAALEGAREIGFTIISMTLSLVVVFVPIVFMAGTIGRILNEFAITITIAILVSGVISLSLTPMLCSRLLRSSSKLAESDVVFDALLAAYRWTLRGALRWRLLVMLLSVVMLAATIYLAVVMPKGFLPSTDQGFLSGFTMAEQGIAFEEMARRQHPLTGITLQNPNVERVLQVVGMGSINQGYIIPLLKPRSQRKDGADETLMQLWPELNTLPGLQVFLQNPPMVSVGGKEGKSLYQFTLLCPDTAMLYDAAPKFEAQLGKLPQLSGVNSDLQIGNPQLEVVLNRDKAATLGITAQAVEEALFTAYGSRRVSTIYAEKDQYRVITELHQDFQKDPSALSLLTIRARDGQLVRLDALADMQTSYGPLTINHSGQLPSVTISFNTAPGVSLDKATRAVQELARQELPGDISTKFEGSASEFQNSMSSLTFLIILAIVVIYLILGILYESFIHPLTILSGLPSAALGGLLTLTFFQLELNLYGFVGIILLIGIVKKNAIMVVDFAIEAQRQGQSTLEAITEGCLTRFRPIMMTTCAAIMGAAPIAAGYGADGAARQPLGLVVVGGLILSQVVTLYLTPVFYTYMDGLAHWNEARAKQKAIARGELEG